MNVHNRFYTKQHLSDARFFTKLGLLEWTDVDLILKNDKTKLFVLQ